MTVSILPALTTDADATLLAAVGDSTRLGIVRQLASEGATCVCRLTVAPTVAPNLLSYHLKVLRDAGLVSAARRGRWIDYSLAEGALDRLHAALPSIA